MDTIKHSTSSMPRPRAGSAAQSWLRPSALRLDLLALLVLWIAFAIGSFLVYGQRRTATVDIGTKYAWPYISGFFANEQDGDGLTYAWTTNEATLRFPGTGPLVRAELNLGGWSVPPTAQLPVTIDTGASRLVLPVEPPVRRYHLLLPTPGGDLHLALASPTRAFGDDNRQLGVSVDKIGLQPLSGTPPLWSSLLALGYLSLFYALARRLRLSVGIALALTAGMLSLGLGAIHASRLLVTIALGQWLATVILLHLLLWPLSVLLRTIYGRSGVALEANELQWLLRIFLFAALFKLSGVLYPHIIVFDEAAHVSRIQRVLDGRFIELYRPGYESLLGATVGLEGGQFPYSPLWYLIIVPLRWLGLPLGDATNGLNALLDTSKLIPIHLISRITLGRPRAALLAALLYQVIPMPYFMLSWGNYPTQFGLWAGLVVSAFFVVHFEQWQGRGTWLRWILLLALAILSYTIMGVVTSSFLVLVAVLAMLRRDGKGWPRLRWVLVGLVLAEVLCFVLYHVQFATTIVQETIPAVVRGLVTKATSEIDPLREARENPLANLRANNIFTVNHFTWPFLIGTLIGGWYVARDPGSRRWWPLWIGWLLTFVFWSVFSGYVADMVLKHVFFMIPLVAIWCGLWLDHWLRLPQRTPSSRRVVQWGRASVALIALTLVLSLSTVRWYHFALMRRHQLNGPDIQLVAQVVLDRVLIGKD